MTIPRQESPQESGDFLLYYISFERLNQLSRSAVAILSSRLGPSNLTIDQELNDPQELVNEIATHSATEPGFIRPDMPIQEIIFRILLSRQNEPTLLWDLHHELTEKWATPIRPINITQEGLQRILDNDTYYGFAQKSPDSQQDEAA
jgi:hypothetical protein